MRVAIRELKSSLSCVLAQAQRGEVVEVDFAQQVGCTDFRGFCRCGHRPAGADRRGRPGLAGRQARAGIPTLVAGRREVGERDSVGESLLILFCDTSALVKLYIAEDFSPEVSEQAQAASAIAICRIAWAEAMATFARCVRKQAEDAEVRDSVRQRLRKDWPDDAMVEVTQPLVELAGDYADTFALRGYDSVQLGAAHIMQEASQEALLFACFDARLQRAAQVLGMAGLGTH